MKRDGLSEFVRRGLKRLPAPHHSHYGVVPPAPPEDGVIVAPIARTLESAAAALARLSAIVAEYPDPYLISRILTRQEAVSSSAIEGTQSTLDELLAVDENALTETQDAVAQVRDYARALETFLPRASREGDAIFSLDLIRDLHRAVMANDTAYKDIPGEWRQIVVWIESADIAYSTYNPAPPEEIVDCLTQTVDYLRNEGMQSVSQNLFTRMAIGHAHFEAVHPFRDGNGRVGRLLLPLMMAAGKQTPLYLSPYIESHKQAYYDGLKAAQQRLDWLPLIAFIAEAVTGTVEELMTTRHALRALATLWLTRRRFRSGSAAARALDLLPHYPIVTANRLAEQLSISTVQANAAIRQLQDVEILHERTGYARNRIFAAEETLLILNRPFGEQPVIGHDTPDGAT